MLLALQQEERKRDEGVMLACLFCSHVFNGRKELFLHMWDLHNFNIGHSDNIGERRTLLGAFLVK